LRLLIRYGGAALAVVLFAIFAIAPFATSFVQQWTHRDIELRATLVFNSVREELSGLLAQGAANRIGSLFERLASDERLLAVGFCDEPGALRFGGNAMPHDVTCQTVARTDRASFSTIRSTTRPIIVASFPLSGGPVRGHLVLVHDLTFAEQRAAQAQTWIIIALAAVALVGAALASFIAVLVMRGWLHSVQRAISDLKTGRRVDDETPETSVLGTRIRDLLHELDETRRSIDASHADWSQETLRSVLVNQLPGTEIVVVSNREPYIHNRGPNGVTVQIPASGLVAAIEPVMRACGGT
jgi:hypothetical protein